MEEIRLQCAVLLTADLKQQIAICQWLSEQMPFAETACTLKRLGYTIREIAEMLSPGSSHPMAETAVKMLGWAENPYAQPVSLVAQRLP